MKVGIVWLPNVGKSTLFNALTKSYAAEAGNFPFCTIEPNSGIVNVNDDRLEKLRAAVNGAKIVPATVEFVDIAGLVQWASQGEWLGNKFLATIREVDAILQVVRVFEDDDVHHVDGSIDPVRDREVINAELIIADLETLEKQLTWSIGKKAKWNDKEAQAMVNVGEKVKAGLEAGQLAIEVDLTDEERILLKGFHLLTNKPFIYAANVQEDAVSIDEASLRKKLDILSPEIDVVAICAKIELDMMEFWDEDRAEFLAEMWLAKNPVDELIKTCFHTLWLQYFFTAGEQEVHAWVIKKWATAPEAAGRIHTDFQDKFIKAEVTNWENIVENSGWSWLRESGKLRLEWKDYIMQEGDTVVFKFGG